MSVEFTELLRRMKDIHEKKSADYATEDNPYSNFERAAVLVSYFSNPVDQVFVSLIGVKIARLAELKQPGRVPQNESIEDTHLDLANYCTLWASYEERNKK